MNNQDIKNQLEMFGMIVKDEEFFKQDKERLKQFITKTKVSDEEEVEVDAKG
jgi:hypothetical protein